jgi:hypothetical protein
MEERYGVGNNKLGRGEKEVGDQSGWRAKIALACYFAVVGGIFLGSLITGSVSLGIGIDIENPAFPVALIYIPITETIILGITLFFAGREGAGLERLGLKRTNIKTLIIVAATTIPLLLLVWSISIGQVILFGPDPMAELLAKFSTPRTPFQLVVMVVFHLVLVGPAEELAFRGFIQRGFENSFGKVKGLLLVSGLFGLLHGLDSLYPIAPLFVAGLVLGYVWQRTGGNTTATALMHGVYNSIVVVLTYFAI